MDTYNPVRAQIDALERAARKVGYLKGWLHSVLLVILVVAFTLLSGCATLIDEHKAPPVGWPHDIQIRDNVVGIWEIQKQCYASIRWYMKAIGGFAMACAYVNFEQNTCDIYRAHDATPEVMEHETLHCRGHSHPGETWAEDGLRNYLANMAGVSIGKVAQ